MPRVFLLALCVALLSTPVAAETIVVITKLDSPQKEISRTEVAELFLGKRRTLDGQAMNALDISDEKLQEAFYQIIAEMSLTRVKAYWARVVFAGQGRPPPRISLVDAVDLINRDNSAITYAYANAIPRGTKVLLRLP